MSAFAGRRLYIRAVSVAQRDGKIDARVRTSVIAEVQVGQAGC